MSLRGAGGTLLDTLIEIVNISSVTGSEEKGTTENEMVG